MNLAICKNTLSVAVLDRCGRKLLSGCRLLPRVHKLVGFSHVGVDHVGVNHVGVDHVGVDHVEVNHVEVNHVEVDHVGSCQPEVSCSSHVRF